MNTKLSKKEFLKVYQENPSSFNWNETQRIEIEKKQDRWYKVSEWVEYTCPYGLLCSVAGLALICGFGMGVYQHSVAGQIAAIKEEITNNAYLLDRSKETKAGAEIQNYFETNETNKEQMLMQKQNTLDSADNLMGICAGIFGLCALAFTVSFGAQKIADRQFYKNHCVWSVYKKQSRSRK